MHERKIVHEQPFSGNLDDYLKYRGVTPNEFGNELMDLVMNCSYEQFNDYLVEADDDILEWNTDKIIDRILINKSNRKENSNENQ